jgi:antitoxin PrlF
VKKAARITSKGQITVPHEIRRALGVRAGDKLLFEKDGSGFRVRPMRVKSAFEKYRGIGSPGIARGKKAVVNWVRRLRSPLRGK